MSNPITTSTTTPFPDITKSSSSSSNNNSTKPLSAMNLRRQNTDTASEVGSSVSSSSQHRRNRRKYAIARAVGSGGGSGALGEVAGLERLADTKPVRLQLGLDLDAELELKARVKGDAIRIERTPNAAKAKQGQGTELKFNKAGIVYSEVFYLRLGRFSFRRTWLEREVSGWLTGGVMAGLVVLGVVVGWGLSGRVGDELW